MTYFEIHHQRKPSITTVSEVSLVSDANFRAGYHLIQVPSPVVVVGYHLAATGSSLANAFPPNGTLGRFWIMTRNVQTFLPDSVVPGSDTADIDVSTPFGVNLGADSDHILAPQVSGADYSVDVLLANPVVLQLPDVYWVGIAIQSTGGGRFRGSFTQGNARGLGDLQYTSSTGANSSILTWSLPLSLEGDDLLMDETARVKNIDVGLITELGKGV